MDRGGDRSRIINGILNKNLRFIIRLKRNRDVVFRNLRRNVLDAAHRCRMLYAETIRFLKQGYHLEDIRVLDYERLKNLVALAVAAAYFSAVWLGESLKLKVLATRVTQVAKRFFGVPDFHYYALSDGIATLLSRLGRWIHREREEKAVSKRNQGTLFDFP